ncbi:MAG: ABC transporter ATP-binding protein, partial [Gemmatimonadetes bacterium]|nr:ABC transporter ATP-binding protein [Gemmatimonadota bacterium]
YPSITLFAGLAVALVLWRGGSLVMQEVISLGDFVAFTGYLALLMWPMAALGWTISLFQRGAASWERIGALLNEPAEPYDAGGARPDGSGRVVFEDVRLRKGEREVLRGIDLDLRPGEITALVGPTGGGKSSLLRLITRLDAPSTGTIRLDGVPLEEWDLPALRAALSYVPQESFLFSESIERNVQMGQPGATADHVREAADLAALTDEIESFREGFDAVVGERGVTLSGGQRQRTTLARALLRDCRVLVLDDAFSNMDTRTEEQILGSLRREISGRTVVLVSHRLSTIRRADRILYLDDGRILETGSHADLVAAGGHYARFVRRQRLLEQLQDDESESAA